VVYRTTEVQSVQSEYRPNSFSIMKVHRHSLSVWIQQWNLVPWWALSVDFPSISFSNKNVFLAMHFFSLRDLCECWFTNISEQTTRRHNIHCDRCDNIKSHMLRVTSNMTSSQLLSSSLCEFHSYCLPFSLDDLPRNALRSSVRREEGFWVRSTHDSNNILYPFGWKNVLV
jgi:hypothetical protein